MGEVYRATDTSLKRPVAIKVLPASVANDPERIARFQREAEVLASLNHPNIAQVYGLERTEGRTALVMELVEGLTLAERIAEGPMTVDEALPIARQIAEGLEAAHERGIVHRDLKPANIKLRPDGTVKVLDFGLAKGFGPDRPTTAGADRTQSPTMTSPAETMRGVLLGTAAYMSPEQAKGKSVDQRADVWAFGAVLFEMLTGRRAFGPSRSSGASGAGRGARDDDLSETLASILRSEPDWAALPADLPAAVRTFLQRSLHKDPKQRVHHVADVRLAMEGAFDVESPAAPAAGGRARYRLPAAIAIVVLGGIAALAWLRPGTTESPSRFVRRFPVTLSPAEQLSGGVGSLLALSPDGQTLVYLAVVDDVFRLYRRTLDELDTAPIPGTEDAAAHPFFSPDGRWVGFHSGPAVMKVALAGGRPVGLGTVSGGEPRGASWGEDDSIIVAIRHGGLVRIPAAGGASTTILTPDDEREYWYPHILPGGRSVLFTASLPQRDTADVFALDLATGTRRLVLRDGVALRYLSSGHLIFLRGGDLWAVAFDPDRLEPVGEAVVVEQGIRVEDGGAVQVSIADDGSLAYVPADVFQDLTPRTLVWVDRQGRETPLGAGMRVFESPRLSPDGGRIAVVIRDSSADIWVHDIALGTLSRLTFDANEDEAPLWSPDGRRIAFSASRGAARVTLQRAADGSGDETAISPEVNHHHLSDWSRDGTLAFESRFGDSASWDTWMSAVGPDATPVAFLQTDATERGAVFSPDGRWVAYESSETGRSEVYVQAYPGGGRKQQISTEGGAEPLWSHAGRELFYRNGDRMMAVDIQVAPGLSASRPHVLFEGSYVRLPWGLRNYDVSRDGQRFLMLKAAGREAPQRVVLVQNWDLQLQRLVR
jgi:serine/threonine-protein kinase